MKAILLKNVPTDLKSRLQREAERNRRSMNQQALIILEQSLPPGLPRELPKPAKTLKKVTAEMIRKGIRAGRE